MEIISKLNNVFEEVLDIETSNINESTYVIRELNAESIDLLEMSVHIGKEFNFEVEDHIIFLRHLRDHIASCSKDDRLKVLKHNYSYLSKERVLEILEDLPNGPVLKVSDLINYIKSKI